MASMVGNCQSKKIVQTKHHSEEILKLEDKIMNLFKDAKLLQTKKISKFAEESNDFKAEVIIAIGRFFKNDWGDICNEDKTSNNAAIPYLEMIVASYETSEGDVYIIGESENGKYYDKVVISFGNEH